MTTQKSTTDLFLWFRFVSDVIIIHFIIISPWKHLRENKISESKILIDCYMVNKHLGVVVIIRFVHYYLQYIIRHRKADLKKSTSTSLAHIDSTAIHNITYA
jgi:hypothetical protein